MLMIKDLAESKTLDRDAMAAVAGGNSYKGLGFRFKSNAEMDGDDHTFTLTATYDGGSYL